MESHNFELAIDEPKLIKQKKRVLKVITDYKLASESVLRDLAKQTKHKHLGTEYLDDDEQ